MTTRTASPTSTDATLRFAAAGVAALVAAIIATYLLVAFVPAFGHSAGPDAPPAPVTASPEPSDDATPRPTPSPTAKPTPSPSPTPSATPTPTPEPTPQATVPPTPVPPTPSPPVVTPPPTPAPIGNVLPPCTYMDVLTPHAGYEEWAITLLDTIYALPSTYAPGDLVDSSAAGLNGGYAIRRHIVGDLAAMTSAARAAGAPIQLVSGYRSHAQQKATFDYWVSVGGYEQALRTSARAGHSEHQLGTAIDVTSQGGAAPWEYADWAATPAGAWMAANAWRYGFVMSYPAGASDRTCYDYEPWHYRYVGRDLAAHVAGSGATLREVLWGRQ